MIVLRSGTAASEARKDEQAAVPADVQLRVVNTVRWIVKSASRTHLLTPIFPFGSEIMTVFKDGPEGIQAAFNIRNEILKDGPAGRGTQAALGVGKDILEYLRVDMLELKKRQESMLLP